MIQEYPVYRGMEQLGKVRVERQGLYYCMSCRCALREEGLYRIVVSCGENRKDLGTLLPMGDGFGMDTRVPVKHLGEGELRFCIQSKHGTRFVPIRPEEPFAYIERLKNSFLEIRDGEKGICVERR